MNHPSKVAVLAGCVCDDCHPSATAYKLGCRCLPCTTRQKRQRKVRRIYGDRTRDASPATRFVRAMVAEGYPVETISRASGVDRNGLWAIHNGTRAKVRIVTVAKLHSLTRAKIAEAAAPTSWLPIIGASRRLQALSAVGWHVKDIPGADWRTLASIRDGYSKRTQARHWHLISDAYERLSMIPGKNPSALRLARRKGWAPPLAWDDIDDPAARPQTGEPDVEPEPDHSERRSMYDSGCSDRAIARSEGVSADAIRHWRMKNKLPANQSGKVLTPLGQEPDDRYALWQQGLTDHDIADRIGRHHDVVRRWRLKHGLEPARRRSA